MRAIAPLKVERRHFQVFNHVRALDDHVAATPASPTVRSPEAHQVVSSHALAAIAAATAVDLQRRQCRACPT
jgi:hypothetical protein